MKIAQYCSILISFQLIALVGAFTATAQVPENVKAWFPEGTAYYPNVAYQNDTLKKHLLDIYVPTNTQGIVPVVIWVHGGAWMMNDKYGDMGYMKQTVRGLLQKGYALVSIDYRHSTTAIFPAQIQDLTAGVDFLYKNAAKYKLDKQKFAVIGFSAGGHLASLLALSLNNDIKEFYPAGKRPAFAIKAAIDFYGPSDFMALVGNGDPDMKGDPLSTLIGASVIRRPDLGKRASPVSYVDKADPPFFIVHGEKDESVPYQQSVLLQSYLNLANVKNEFTLVAGAPHFGEMFDSPEIRERLFAFLDHNLK